MYSLPQLLRYKYLSAGLLSHRDRYPEHLRAVQLHLGGGVGQPGGVAPGLSDVSAAVLVPVHAFRGRVAE